MYHTLRISIPILCLTVMLAGCKTDDDDNSLFLLLLFSQLGGTTATGCGYTTTAGTARAAGGPVNLSSSNQNVSFLSDGSSYSGIVLTGTLSTGDMLTFTSSAQDLTLTTFFVYTDSTCPIDENTRLTGASGFSQPTSTTTQKTIQASGNGSFSVRYICGLTTCTSSPTIAVRKL